MCRLYGFHANEPTRIECSLIYAQNALMAQSIRDREGLTHGHGWGVAGYPDGVPFVEKQAWAAYDGTAHLPLIYVAVIEDSSDDLEVPDEERKPWPEGDAIPIVPGS